MDEILDIFENEAIDIEAIDFSRWLTEDGELVEIDELKDDQIRDIIYTLKRKCKLLPEHVNEDIWEEYLQVFQEKAAERKQEQR